MNDRQTKKVESMKQELAFPDIDAGYNCPCCGSFCKRYRRKLNSNMAVVLIALFRKKKFGFIKVEEFMRVNGYKRSGDFPYLCHWGLLEKMTGDRPDGSSRNGYYKITDKGRQFVLHQISVPQVLLIYNNKCEGFEGEEIFIDTALGRSFNYKELMGDDFRVYNT